MRPVELRFGDLRIEGWSRAGDQTWFRVHPPGLAFDTGRGAQQLAGAHDVFLTHAHLDHALGLPYVLSQRSLHKLLDTRVFCPVEARQPLADFIAAAERMENARYRYELIPLSPGDRVEVGRDLAVEAFATDHVVPSLGYHLWRSRKRLAAAFSGLPPAELISLRERGVDTSELISEIWLSYCGDTGPWVFEMEPRIFGSRVLLLEATFLGEAQKDQGDRYKHLHLDDIAERAADFRNQAIVLHHLTHRYQVADLRAAIASRMPELAPRIHVLVEEERD